MDTASLPNADYAGAVAYALNRLRTELPPKLHYHNVMHTEGDVLPAAVRLAELSGLPEADIHLLEVAAAFHDLGQIRTVLGHELIGAEIVSDVLPRYGFSPEFIRSMISSYGLWRKPMDGLCRKAAEMKVKEIMSRPTHGEYVEEEASLDTAIHLLVMGRHQSLLVTRGEAIVGILRLSDVFRKVCDSIKACRI